MALGVQTLDLETLTFNLGDAKLHLSTQPERKEHYIYSVETHVESFNTDIHGYIRYDADKGIFLDTPDGLKPLALPSDQEEEQFKIKLGKIYTSLIRQHHISL